MLCIEFLKNLDLLEQMVLVLQKKQFYSILMISLFSFHTSIIIYTNIL